MQKFFIFFVVAAMAVSLCASPRNRRPMSEHVVSGVKAARAAVAQTITLEADGFAKEPTYDDYFGDKAMKVVRDGKLLIVREGNIYNIIGQKM